ncbi:MAG: DUF1109 domain-containing protein [Xanthobacteraceae bacterium]
MKTDDLIAMLSTNVEPVDRRNLARTFGAALAIGGVAAIGVALLGFGLRTDITEASAFISLALKIIFTTGVFGLASTYLIRFARPGGERCAPLMPLALPFLGIMALAVVSLASAPRPRWQDMILGDQWLECLLSIPVIAVVPFAVIIWAVRQAMPTDLRRAGALAGLVAGALSATGYALHCVDDSMPFVALWYGGTIALCTLAGWALGPRLLRW